METVATVRRVGGSLMVTIPRQVAEVEGIREGMKVRLEVARKREGAFGAFPGLGPWEHDDVDWGHD